MTKSQRIFLIAVGLLLLFVSGDMHLVSGGIVAEGLVLLVGAVITAFGIVG